jgi:uncharacterized protein with von Willebrand factor type A (vWA) domain
MEIKNELNNVYSNPSVESKDVSSLSNSVNLKALDTTAAIDASTQSTYSLNIDSNYKRSDLANVLKDTISNISQNQIASSNLEQQKNILNNIQEAATKIVQSNTPETTADEVQPEVAEFISQYNNLSVDVNKAFQESQGDTESHAYFDGVLGAKPLSPSEILEAVEQQMKVIKEQTQLVDTDLQKFETKALDTIGKEIAQTNAKAPFEPVDFGKNMANFTSANINNVVGSVATAQANAIPAHSPKLLS